MALIKDNEFVNLIAAIIDHQQKHHWWYQGCSEGT